MLQGLSSRPGGTGTQVGLGLVVICLFFFFFFPLFESYGGSHSRNTNHSFFECLLQGLWRDLRGLLRVFPDILGFLNLDQPVTYHGFVMSITAS